MKGLTPDDLLPLDEYAGRRAELFAAHCRYVDRYRRVRIGPGLTLVFENRQTLWFRVQEVLRVARLAEPRWVRRELEVYNRLLPGRGRLQAALLLQPDAATDWQGLRGEDVALHAGPHRCPADLYTARPEDRCVGAAHWAQFVLDDAARAALADARQPAHFAAACGAYRHESAPLGDDVRQSLLDDLALSDRDA
jgi:hypothetical protein